MCQAIFLSKTKIFVTVLINFSSVEFSYSVHIEDYMSLTNHLPLKNLLHLPIDTCSQAVLLAKEHPLILGNFIMEGVLV